MTNHTFLSVKSDVIKSVIYHHHQRQQCYTIGDRVRGHKRDWYVCEILMNAGRVNVYVKTLLNDNVNYGAKQLYRSFPLVYCILEYKLEYSE